MSCQLESWEGTAILPVSRTVGVGQLVAARAENDLGPGMTIHTKERHLSIAPYQASQ